MPEMIWILFIFAIGCCIGSFLNVVIYRVPRDKSLVTPPSTCPGCGMLIRFYDNIPLFSWLVLGGKCRKCKQPISSRYFVIELLTGLVFVGAFYLYFMQDIRWFEIAGKRGMGAFFGGGWYFYVIYLTLFCGLIACSAIDLELWIIPITICWFVTAVGVIGSSLGGFFIRPIDIRGYNILPSASVGGAAVALGCGVGLVISLVLLMTGVIKRSYEGAEAEGDDGGQENEEKKFNDRLEVCKEVVFLLPIVICAIVFYKLSKINLSVETWWVDFSQRPVVAGFMGSVLGYFVGCGVVWITRILGTLGFGREAMGLGDVHLMGAAGAVIGPVFVVVVFFVAPFFGLIWALVQRFFKKIRQIPYGPFLSMGILTVMILHDWIRSYIFLRFYY